MGNCVRNWVKRILDCALVAFGLLNANWAFAEYPEHAIKLVVPYAPGGSSDIVSRHVAEFLGKALGQAVVVENIGGGGGAIGTQRVAHAAADGYTLLVGANSELLINKLLQPNLEYDALRDFTPIALIGTGANVIVGKPTLSAATFQDVLALARSRSGGLNYGTSGHGTIQHLAGEMLRLRTKANIAHVAYRGAGPLMNDIIGNHIDLGVATLASAKVFIESGQARAYAVTSAQRSEFAPQIPALSEFPELSNFDLEVWWGLFAPAKLSPAIASTIEQKMLSVLDNPELKRNLAKQAISISKKTSKELAAYLISENEKFRTIISDGKISVK